jgi:hypothetical protein
MSWALNLHSRFLCDNSTLLGPFVSVAGIANLAILQFLYIYIVLIIYFRQKSQIHEKRVENTQKSRTGFLSDLHMCDMGVAKNGEKYPEAQATGA